MPTRLIEHCEPLFQTVCRFNRMGRKGSAVTYAVARAEIETLLEKLTTSARGDLALSEQFRKVELPIIFFIDSMIAESALPYADEWNRHRLAYARNELAGDEKFFDLLEAAIEDKTDGADERLAIFYTCMGLGFTGWYGGQPEFLRKKMLEIAPRVKAFVDTDESGMITPEAYQHTNSANLPLPMSASLVPLLIVLTGLFLVVVAVNFYTFDSVASRLNTTLESIITRQAAQTTKP
jgi:type VI secretion system protein ImpK